LVHLYIRNVKRLKGISNKYIYNKMVLFNVVFMPLIGHCKTNVYVVSLKSLFTGVAIAYFSIVTLAIFSKLNNSMTLKLA
jgi:hypothetical protein